MTGVEFEKDGATHREHGAVVIATGGFAADFSPSGVLASVRPDLLKLPTTNGEHCTGDGIKLASAGAVRAGTVDMASVQVHPTGLVHPDEPEAKVKWLAAEALRGVGGIMLDAHGKARRSCSLLALTVLLSCCAASPQRFVDELGACAAARDFSVRPLTCACCVGRAPRLCLGRDDQAPGPLPSGAERSRRARDRVVRGALL